MNADISKIQKGRIRVQDSLNSFLRNKKTKSYEQKDIKAYKQFERIESKGVIVYQCPSCHEPFGISTKYLEKIGESSYLRPFQCPYCHKEYTIKN